MTETPTTSRRRFVRHVAWTACAAMALVVAAALIWLTAKPGRLPDPIHIGEADIRSEFALTDHTGRRVTEASYAGQWQLVFFGFTHCPDICPTTLAYMGTVIDELGDDAHRVAPLFITVDPARDTVPVIAEYVSAFHPRLIGLTGSEAEVAAASHAFKAYGERVDDPAAPGGYSVAHSGHIYLMGPDGRFVDLFREREQAPEAMASEILDRMGSEDA